MLTETSRTTGVLFPVSEDRAVENGPTFTGSVKLDGVSVPLSAFLKAARDSDKRFLDLSVGAKGQAHFSGRLFRTEEKKTAKSPDYSGYLVVLPLSPGMTDEYSQEEWDAAARLIVYGRRMRNADNSVRIALDILPKRLNKPIGDDEVAL
jgi:hypothetical protein